MNHVEASVEASQKRLQEEEADSGALNATVAAFKLSLEDEEGPGFPPRSPCPKRAMLASAEVAAPLAKTERGRLQQAEMDNARLENENARLHAAFLAPPVAETRASAPVPPEDSATVGLSHSLRHSLSLSPSPEHDTGVPDVLLPRHPDESPLCVVEALRYQLKLSLRAQLDVEEQLAKSEAARIVADADADEQRKLLVERFANVRHQASMGSLEHGQARMVAAMQAAGCSAVAPVRSFHSLLDFGLGLHGVSGSLLSTDQPATTRVGVDGLPVPTPTPGSIMSGATSPQTFWTPPTSPTSILQRDTYIPPRCRFCGETVRAGISVLRHEDACVQSIAALRVAGAGWLRG